MLFSFTFSEENNKKHRTKYHTQYSKVLVSCSGKTLINLNKGGCLWMWLGCNDSTGKYEIFVVAALLGGGGVAMTICSLTLVTTFVGTDIGIMYNISRYIDHFFSIAIIVDTYTY